MTNKELRRKKLADLIAEYGSQKAFGDAVGKDPAMFSQILNGTRNLGDKLALDLEEKLGKPRGWMDVLHDNEAMRVINGDPMLPSKEVGQYNLTIDEIKELLTNKQLIAYQGRYKNILSAEEEGRIDETDKLLLAALDQKYKR